MVGVEAWISPISSLGNMPVSGSTHIGLFGEAGYNWVGGGSHNFNSSVKDFVQVNFGLRWAF